MCGITGYYVRDGEPDAWLRDLPAAVKSLHQRGPDDSGNQGRTDPADFQDQGSGSQTRVRAPGICAGGHIVLRHVRSAETSGRDCQRHEIPSEPADCAGACKQLRVASRPRRDRVGHRTGSQERNRRDQLGNSASRIGDPVGCRYGDCRPRRRLPAPLF